MESTTWSQLPSGQQQTLVNFISALHALPVSNGHFRQPANSRFWHQLTRNFTITFGPRCRSTETKSYLHLIKSGPATWDKSQFLRVYAAGLLKSMDIDGVPVDTILAELNAAE